MPSKIAFDSDAIQNVFSTGGGIYATRKERKSMEDAISSNQADEQNGSIIEKDVIDERDVKKRQTFGKLQTFWLGYQSLGVIYGDIGTSPLYVYSSTFSDNPSHADLVGALSLIIWSLTIMVTVKYIMLVLVADDEGEGQSCGTGPPRAANNQNGALKSNEMKRPNHLLRTWLENSKVVKWIFKIVGVGGVSLLLADGVLTPAQSLLGAIQGAAVVNSNIDSSVVIGASSAIIVLIYAVQPFGTGRLSVTFAPIVIVWLMFNFTFGIYNLAIHDASVLKAFNPYYAGAFLERNGYDGWMALGGILLAFTGCETLFADLGAFNRQAIQISWCCFVYPCLLVGYIGQAAYISRIPSAWENPFYLTIPPGMLWPGLIFAILACIVASQAVITGAFQLLSQIMKLSYFPQITVRHTSKNYHGQVYIPLANWILMIGTVIVTCVYTNTTNLGHAYGVCVILVSSLTTYMVALVALIVWRLPLYVVLPILLIFILWDGMFLSAALTKVPSGAWVTLMIAAVLTSFFVFWRYSKEEQWKADAADKIPLSHALHFKSDLQDKCSPRLHLSPALGGGLIITTSGLGIFFDKIGSEAIAPHVFVEFLQKFKAATEFIVLFHLRPLYVPTVAPEEQFSVSRCFAGGFQEKEKSQIPNCFRLTVRYGYTDEVVTPDLGRLVNDAIRKFLLAEDQAKAETRSSLEALERAYSVAGLKVLNEQGLPKRL